MYHEWPLGMSSEEELLRFMRAIRDALRVGVPDLGDQRACGDCRFKSPWARGPGSSWAQGYRPQGVMEFRVQF